MEEEVENARRRGRNLKKERECKVNASKFRKEIQITVGDTVLIRKLDKKIKFNPNFSSDKFTVLEISGDKTVITVMRLSDKKVFKRHPDDIKVLRQPQLGTIKKPRQKLSEYEETQIFFKELESIVNSDDSDYNIFDKCTGVFEENGITQFMVEPRRSKRTKKQNSRYFNEDFISQ